MRISSPEVCKRADITYRQLDHWVSAGLIPGVEHAKWVGSGNQRMFGTQEVRFVVHLAKLVNAGLNVRVASNAIQEQRVGSQLPDKLQLAGGVVISL